MKIHWLAHRFTPRTPLLALMALAIVVVAGCATPPPSPVAPAGLPSEETQRQLRMERARASLADGVKAYEAGNYEEALKYLLLSLDSGALLPAEQLNARKHLAFTHCVNGRELQCKEEFEKSFALDGKFELAASEAGHPIWGPIYRLVKTERDIKASGRSLPPTTKLLSPGEKLLAEGNRAYEEGDFSKALKLFQDALTHTLTVADQTTARKYAAFCHCLAGKSAPCRAEFEKILAINPKFELEPAEAGHPSWGPSFRAAKAKIKPPAAK